MMMIVATGGDDEDDDEEEDDRGAFLWDPFEAIRQQQLLDRQ